MSHSQILLPLFSWLKNGDPEAEVVLLNWKLYIVEMQMLRAEGAQMWFWVQEVVNHDLEGEARVCRQHAGLGGVQNPTPI